MNTTTEGPDRVARLRGSRQVTMVTVLEGNGKDIPLEETHYIIDNDGRVFGRLVREWQRFKPTP